MAGHRRDAGTRRGPPRTKSAARRSRRRPALWDIICSGSGRLAGGLRIPHSCPTPRARPSRYSALAPYPLLLLDGSFVFRRNFDAACRLAGFEPAIRFESRTPHTLLAMAERGHGVAVIPSALRTDRHSLRIVGLTYRGKPLREPLAVFWDKRRPLPRYGDKLFATCSPSICARCSLLRGHTDLGRLPI